MQDALQLLINLSYALPIAMNLVMIIATLIGIVIFATAWVDIWERSQVGIQLNGAGDTLRTKSILGRLLIGSILASSLYWLNITGNTLLMGQTVNGSSFLYQGTGLSEQQQIALRAVFDLLILTGYIAFIRGWTLLQKFFDNVIREYGKAIVHIVFGTLLVYLDQVLEIAGDWTGFHFIGTVLF